VFKIMARPGGIAGAESRKITLTSAEL
jgi:hypothetical protein